MQAFGGDLVKWRSNPPYASDMGSVWEQQIHLASSILQSLMSVDGRLLKEELLVALMSETEVMMN